MHTRRTVAAPPPVLQPVTKKVEHNKKVAKIALNANFTCPNKDGKVTLNEGNNNYEDTDGILQKTLNIKEPFESTQIEAVKISYDALRYINQPSRNTEIEAIKTNEAAISFIRDLNKEKTLDFLKENIMV